MSPTNPKVPCQARTYRRKGDICGEPTDTTRKVQAAPGLWIHVRLCHYHQHIWDEGQAWGGPDIVEEPLCYLGPECRYIERLRDAE